jgi:hypothetical protein
MTSWVSGQVPSPWGKSHSTITFSTPMRWRVSIVDGSSSVQNQKFRFSTSPGRSLQSTP